MIEITRCLQVPIDAEGGKNEWSVVDCEAEGAVVGS